MRWSARISLNAIHVGCNEIMKGGKNQFLVNSEIYHINTRKHANFHQPSVNLTKYQKKVYCLGVKVFNIVIVIVILFSVP